MSEQLSSILSENLRRMLMVILKYLFIISIIVLFLNTVSLLWEPHLKILVENSGLILAVFSGWGCFHLIKREKLIEATRLFIITGFSLGIFVCWICYDMLLFSGPFIITIVTLMGLFSFKKKESFIWIVIGQCLSFCAVFFIHPLNFIIDTGYSMWGLAQIAISFQVFSWSVITLAYSLSCEIKQALVRTCFKFLSEKSKVGRQHRLLEETRLRESKVQEIFNLIPDMIFQTDLEGHVLMANTASLDYLNCPLVEIENRLINDFLTIKDTDSLKKAYERIKEGESVRHLEIHTQIRKKTYRYFELNGDPLYENKKICRLFFLIRDITDNIEHRKRILKRSDQLNAANERLLLISSTDALTGLKNRLKLEKIMDQEFQRAKRYKDPFSIILIDIDHFKRVNDTYGHPIGDKVLKILSGILKKTIRRTDVAGRWGGEEFLIVCRATNRESTFILAENLRNIVQAHHIEGVFPITISQGVAEYQEGDRMMDIISRADQGLYYAKNNGRNQSSIYEPLLNSLACGELSFPDQ